MKQSQDARLESDTVLISIFESKIQYLRKVMDVLNNKIINSNHIKLLKIVYFQMDNFYTKYVERIFSLEVDELYLEIIAEYYKALENCKKILQEEPEIKEGELRVEDITFEKLRLENITFEKENIFEDAAQVIYEDLSYIKFPKVIDVEVDVTMEEHDPIVADDESINPTQHDHKQCRLAEVKEETNITTFKDEDAAQVIEHIYEDLTYIKFPKEMDVEIDAKAKKERVITPTIEREDIKWHFISPESPHFGGTRKAGYVVIDATLDPDPPDEEPNDDVDIKVFDDGGTYIK